MKLLGNPILSREFRFYSHSFKTALLAGGYLLALALTLLALWPSDAVLSVVSATSQRIFSLFFSVNLTLMILLVPAFTASSITYEKENHTFSALFTTLLSPFDIMIGKLIASIIMLVMLVMLSTPIASVCALTGGVSLDFMIKVIALIMTTAISYGLIGLVCSSVCQRGSNAILLSYVLIMVVAGGSWLPDALLGNLLEMRWLWQLVRCASPFDALFYLLNPESYRLTVNINLAILPVTPYVLFMLFSVVLSLVCFAVFYQRIRRPTESSSGPRGEIFDDRGKAMKRKLTWPFYLIDPLKRKKMIRRFANPVFVAEMRGKLFSNPKFVIRSVSAILIISLIILTLIALQFGDALRADTVRMVAIVFQIGVVAMLAPSVSSGLITDEIATGTLTALRMTPLKPHTVIIGKLKATFFYAMIFIISSLFILFAMAYLEQQEVFPEGSMLSGEWWSNLIEMATQKEGWWSDLWSTYHRLAAWIAILLLSTITFLAAGLFSSSVARTTGIATAMGYSLTAIICLVTFAPVAVGGRLAHSVAATMLMFNPVAAAMQVTSDAFEQYPGLWRHNLAALGGLCAFFLLAATVRTWYLFHRQE